MARATPAAILLLATLLVVPGLAYAFSSSECSVHDDVCTAIHTQDGRLKFELSTRYPKGHWSFRGNYQLCVHNPVNVKRCKWFELKHKGQGGYFDRVDFTRNFPSNRPGKYTVIWHKSHRQVNRPLRFKP